jgi:hypothetical protein
VSLPDGRRVPWNSDALPILPSIDLERVWSCDRRKGEVVMFHPNCTHGGGFVDAGHPERTTLVFRFFGGDCLFRQVPTDYPDPRLEGVRDGGHSPRGFDWIRAMGAGLAEGGTATGQAQAKL